MIPRAVQSRDDERPFAEYSNRRQYRHPASRASLTRLWIGVAGLLLMAMLVVGMGS